MMGCCTVIDGYAIQITKPKLRHCPNPASYYNRKGFYALILQAGCDFNRIFTFASITCAGSTHDSVAFEISALGRRLQSNTWPAHLWIGGDAAYSVGENMVTPYPGRNLDEAHDAFNYFFSSRLRINIECAFGMIWKRFPILHGPLQYDITFVPEFICVLLKLHNIIVRSGLDESGIPVAPCPIHYQDTVCVVILCLGQEGI